MNHEHKLPEGKNSIKRENARKQKFQIPRWEKPTSQNSQHDTNANHKNKQTHTKIKEETTNYNNLKFKLP